MMSPQRRSRRQEALLPPGRYLQRTGAFLRSGSLWACVLQLIFLSCLFSLINQWLVVEFRGSVGYREVFPFSASLSAIGTGIRHVQGEEYSSKVEAKCSFGQWPVFDLQLSRTSNSTLDAES